MGIVSRHWVPSAAVIAQERGNEFLAAIDGADWSQGLGFYRGFFSAFRVRAGKDVWFHFPLPTPTELGGKPLYLDSVSLLWEVMDGALISWITLQHGGMERIELTPRQSSPASVPVPFEPAPDFKKWCPETHRQLSEISIEPRIALQFGVQLCVQISAPAQDGTIRFYGAGAAFADQG